MKFEKEIYFGEKYKSKLKKLNEYQALVEKKLDNGNDYSFPLLSGSYTLDFYNYLEKCILNKTSLTPEETIDYLMFYFNNLPDWTHPGAMINVIPAVNLVSAAISNIAETFNPNCAQDTYSGNLLLAELEVIKYVSDLLAWDWKKSTGIFTFGGTGTNLYSLKLSLINADSKSSFEGIKEKKYFTITSKNGHPCHYQLCDWIGIGTSSCIEAKCLENGAIDVEDVSNIIDKNINEGKIFLGFNLTGGSTNEMIIDSIKNIYDLRENIVVKYSLDYIPWIHVDSVLGWVFLFFQHYDFDKNEYNFNAKVISNLKSLLYKVREFKYADSIGIDFHKTGFCEYMTSLFIVKDKQKYFNLNSSKAYDIEKLKYGDYNPFYISLEYSRSCKGPISALACLKSLGEMGFCSLVGNLMNSAIKIRETINKHSNVMLLVPEIEGFATIFTLIPPDIKILSVDDLKELSIEKINRIKEINIMFGKKVLHDCVLRKKEFIFTASRSYTIEGTSISIGALKIYPMSIFLDEETAFSISSSILSSIEEFFLNYPQMNDYQLYDVFHDMSKEEK